MGRKSECDLISCVDGIFCVNSCGGTLALCVYAKCLLNSFLDRTCFVVLSLSLLSPPVNALDTTCRTLACSKSLLHHSQAFTPLAIIPRIKTLFACKSNADGCTLRLGYLIRSSFNKPFRIYQNILATQYGQQAQEVTAKDTRRRPQSQHAEEVWWEV